MVLLVSGEAHHRLQAYIAVSYYCLVELFVFCHCRNIYHRNIQDASTQQWGEPFEYRHSHQYRAVSQLLPEHDERGWMRSHPAMV